MSDFTIEQLEALKEGTTPGPWGHTSLGYEAEKYPVYGCVPGDEVALVRRQDWELVSAAPALVAALIAEKQAHAEIRKRIEALRAECKTVVDENGKGHDGYAPNDVAAFIEECHYNALTRILEGEA